MATVLKLLPSAADGATKLRSSNSSEDPAEATRQVPLKDQLVNLEATLRPWATWNGD